MKTGKNLSPSAAAEGVVTGKGGFLPGLADFPLLPGIKLKMLFDIAALYGLDVNDYRERVYILHVFEPAFSSQEHRRAVYWKTSDWERQKQSLPDDITAFDWLPSAKSIAATLTWQRWRSSFRAPAR